MSVIIKSLMDQYEAFNVLFLPFSLKVCSQHIKMQLRHNLFLAFGSQEECFLGRVRVYTGWLSGSKARRPQFQKFYGALSFGGISDCWADVCRKLHVYPRALSLFESSALIPSQGSKQKGLNPVHLRGVQANVNNRIREAGESPDW